MFLGHHYITLDDKGRIKIPSSFKAYLDVLKEDILVLTDFNNCIRAYPPEEWNTLSAKYREMSVFQENREEAERFFFSSAHETKIDKQGRLLIPSSLRSRSGLREDIILLGIHYRFEIWDRARWEDYQEASRDKREQIIKSLSRAGF